jgi:hypothetical protein
MIIANTILLITYLVYYFALYQWEKELIKYQNTLFEMRDNNYKVREALRKEIETLDKRYSSLQNPINN